jgi:hypothetical protein
MAPTDASSKPLRGTEYISRGRILGIGGYLDSEDVLVLSAKEYLLMGIELENECCGCLG